MGMIRMAVSNTGLGSETPVLVTTDPTVLYTGDAARSPLRALAQIVMITGLKWRGIGSSGVSMSYAAEAAVVNADTPTFDAPDIAVEKTGGEIEFTVEVDDDWPVSALSFSGCSGSRRQRRDQDHSSRDGTTRVVPFLCIQAPGLDGATPRFYVDWTFNPRRLVAQAHRRPLPTQAFARPHLALDQGRFRGRTTGCHRPDPPGGCWRR
jgi:hypothetical protein